MSVVRLSVVPCLLFLAACARPLEAAPESPPSTKGTAEHGAAGSPGPSSAAPSPSAPAASSPIVRTATVSGAAGLSAEFSVAPTVALDPRVDAPQFAPILAALAHPLAVHREENQDLAAIAAADARWTAFAGPSAKRTFPFEPSELPVTIRITNTSTIELALSDPKSDDVTYGVAVTSGSFVGVLGEQDLSLRYFSGTPVKLAPGASFDVQQPRLKFGDRSARCGIYFTKEGPATVELVFATAILGPGGRRSGVVLRSGPIGIEVTK